VETRNWSIISFRAFSRRAGLGGLRAIHPFSSRQQEKIAARVILEFLRDPIEHILPITLRALSDREQIFLLFIQIAAIPATPSFYRMNHHYFSGFHGHRSLENSPVLALGALIL